MLFGLEMEARTWGKRLLENKQGPWRPKVYMELSVRPQPRSAWMLSFLRPLELAALPQRLAGWNRCFKPYPHFSAADCQTFIQVLLFQCGGVRRSRDGEALEEPRCVLVGAGEPSCRQIVSIKSTN